MSRVVCSCNGFAVGRAKTEVEIDGSPSVALASNLKACYLASMKATIDFDEMLYRRLKVEAARRGRSIRDLVADGVRHVLSQPPVAGEATSPLDAASWFGSLRTYAKNAGGEHDLASMRRSVAKGRQPRP